MNVWKSTLQRSNRMATHVRRKISIWRHNNTHGEAFEVRATTAINRQRGFNIAINGYLIDLIAMIQPNLTFFSRFKSDALAHFNLTRKNETFTSSLIENSLRINSNKKAVWLSDARSSIQLANKWTAVFFSFFWDFCLLTKKIASIKTETMYFFLPLIDLIFIRAQMDEPWVCTYTHVAANINVDE